MLDIWDGLSLNALKKPVSSLMNVILSPKRLSLEAQGFALTELQLLWYPFVSATERHINIYALVDDGPASAIACCAEDDQPQVHAWALSIT
jgi:hypothetical protein